MKVRLTIFMLLLASGVLTAQQPAVTVTRSTQIMTDGNNRYYVHQVKRGETVYSICRAYGITEADLMRDNPNIAGQAIKVDMWLKILIPQTNTSVPKYVEHVVQVKETLYSIAKQYGVSVEEIVALNPESDKKLTIGRVLQIPAVKKDSTAITTTAQPSTQTPSTATSGDRQTSAANGVTLLEHEIKRKETLFSISNMYEVDIDAIKQYNPQVFIENKGKIRVGQILYIPISLSGMKKSGTVQAAEHRVPCDSSSTHRMPSINVSILLPFNAEQQDDADQLYRSFRFLEVYEGALLALENLSRQGLSVNLSVFDTKSAGTNMLLRNSSLAKADLIIGPVYQDMFKPVAEFAKQKNIKIVSPLAPIDSALYGYSNVFQIPVEFDKQVQQSLINDKLDPVESNIILVSQRDEEASKNLRNYYRQYLPKTDSILYRNSVIRKDSSELDALRKLYEKRSHNPVVKNLSYKIGLQPRDNQEVFLKIFSSKLENKVVVASQDEPFVSELLANLKAFSDRYKCRITIYGANSWQKFENLELKLFYDLKLHIAAPYYINYKSDAVKTFVQDYRDKYKTEPSQFAFQGYDIMMYFASALHRYGKDFEGCLPYHRVQLLQSNYSFTPIYPGGAYENKGVFLLRYTPWMEIVQYK